MQDKIQTTATMDHTPMRQPRKREREGPPLDFWGYYRLAETPSKKRKERLEDKQMLDDNTIARRIDFEKGDGENNNDMNKVEDEDFEDFEDVDEDLENEEVEGADQDDDVRSIPKQNPTISLPITIPKPTKSVSGKENTLDNPFGIPRPVPVSNPYQNHRTTGDDLDDQLSKVLRELELLSSQTIVSLKQHSHELLSAAEYQKYLSDMQSIDVINRDLDGLIQSLDVILRPLE